MAFAVTLNTKEFQEFILALARYPQQMQKAAAKILRDQAYNFKKEAVAVLESAYTIRDKKFVEGKAWKVTAPNEGDTIDRMRATAATMRIQGTGGLFTGWEEELTGKPREMRKGSGRYHRQIWSNAREGNSVYGLALPQYRLRAGGAGYNPDRPPDSRNYGLPIPQFLAMIAKSDASGQSKRAKHFKKKDYALGKNKVFIMEDGATHPLGLYTFKDGQVKALQSFEENPVESAVGKFDWRGEAEGSVTRKFTPEHVWEKYLRPVIERLRKK